MHCADVARSARPVLNDDRLPERHLHLEGNGTHGDVGATARCEANHDVHRFARECTGLRVPGGNESEQEQQTGDKGVEQAAPSLEASNKYDKQRGIHESWPFNSLMHEEWKRRALPRSARS